MSDEQTTQTTPATAPEVQSAAPAASAPAAAAPAAPATAAPAVAAKSPRDFHAEIDGEFEPENFMFESKPYRVTFKNGNSGEYSGESLCYLFPFAPELIASIQPVEDVGKEIGGVQGT